MDGRKCGVISCQSLAPGQEDIHAEVRQATSLLLISLLNDMNRQESAAGYTELIRGQQKIFKKHCVLNACMINYVRNYNKETQHGQFGHLRQFCSTFSIGLQLMEVCSSICTCQILLQWLPPPPSSKRQVGRSLCFPSSYYNRGFVVHHTD